MWALVGGLWSKVQLYAIIAGLLLAVAYAIYALGGSHTARQEEQRQLRDTVRTHEQAREVQQSIDRSSDGVVRGQLRDRWTTPE